jgi:hypothetical protein
MLSESIGPMIYILVLAAALVCLGIALGRRERDPEKH